MTERSTLTRALPMLEIVPPAAPSAPRLPASPADDRLAEYLPEARTLPRFHVWTLGCQMNRSDSEEMAGRLLAAGCEEAASLETADLVVINTCAIREGAEQKVIGRMGQLDPAQGGQPGDAGGADRLLGARAGPGRPPPPLPGGRPLPAARRGARAHRSARVSPRPRRRSGRSAATTTVGRTVVGVADHLAATRARAVGEGTVARGSAIAAWLPIIYGCDKTCTYCIVPFSRGPERSRPFDDIVDEARALAAAGYREVTLLGQNVNSYGHDLAPEARFAHVDAERWAGRRLDLAGRPDLAELIRAIDALRTADGHAAIGRLRFVTSHPWDLSDRLIAALADCTSVCEHLHLPVQSGSDAVLRRMGRQYTIEHYAERLARIREAVPGHHDLDRHHRRLLRRDRGAVRGDPGAARDRPLRPGLRRGLLAAARNARHAPRRRRARGRTSGAGSTSCSPSRRRSGWSATRRGSGARSRSWSTRSIRRAATSTTTTEAAGDGRTALRPHPRQQAGPPRRRRGARRARGPGPHRPRRSVRAARRARRSVTEAPPLIVIAGATATGKTELAIRLAEAVRTGGRPVAIISADSRQVFRGLDIGTAKVTAADRARVPHHGLDLVDPDQPFSVADFATHARAVLARPGARRWRRDPRRRHGPLPARRRRAASTPTPCPAIRTSAPDSRPS